MRQGIRVALGCALLALAGLWGAGPVAAQAASAAAGQASPSGSARAPDYRAALERSQAAIGMPVGEFKLRDSAGRTVRLSDWRGKPLLVSFVYTGCFEVCPTATQFLARAVRTARDALGADSFQVVTIGFNQPFDDPRAMAAFARQSRIDDPRWAFLSPEPGDVDALTANFGFSYEATPRGFDHVVQVSVVDGSGVVYRQIYGENFEMPMLVQPLKELLSGQASQVFTVENLWERVKLYCTVYDPTSGGYRANYSLFFEIFAGVTTLGAIAWMLLRELRRSRRA